MQYVKLVNLGTYVKIKETKTAVSLVKVLCFNHPSVRPPYEDFVAL